MAKIELIGNVDIPKDVKLLDVKTLLTYEKSDGNRYEMLFEPIYIKLIDKDYPKHEVKKDDQ